MSRSKRCPALATLALAVFVVSFSALPSAASGSTATTASITQHATCNPPNAQADACWEGYVVQGSVTSANGAWTVPSTTNVAAGTGSSMWIGIGGISSELLQTGVSQIKDQSGVMHTWAWWEVEDGPPGAPNGNHSYLTSTGANAIPTVVAGDRMRARIYVDPSNAGQYDFVLSDLTRNETGSTHISYAGPAKSAEWILEAPGSPGWCSTTPYCTLANYGSSGFDSMVVNNVDPYRFGLSSALQLVIDQGNVTYAPSNLSREYDAFNVEYAAQPGPPLGPHRRIAVARNTNGELEAFAVGSNDQLYTTTEVSANGAFTGGWHPVGVGDWPNGEDVTVGVNADGRVELFMIGQNGSLYHDYETTASCTTAQLQAVSCWSGWGPISGNWHFSNQDSIGIGRDVNGHLSIVLRGLNGQLFTKTQDPTAAGGWGPFQEIGGSYVWPSNDTIAVGPNQNGMLQVFVEGWVGEVWSMYEQKNSSGSLVWTNPSTVGFGGIAMPFNADIAVGINGDGRLELFVVGTDGYVYHDYQVAINSTWSNFQRLGTITDSSPDPTIQVGRQGNGRLQVFLARQDNNLWTIYQPTSGGWSSWFQLASGKVTPAYDAIGLGYDQNAGINLFLVDQTSLQIVSTYQRSSSCCWSGYQQIGTGSWID